jgi:lipopolysaccharide export system ATP-binding protein
MVAHLKEKNIGILITDHNVNETLRITDYAYLLYEGSVLHQGDPETMANDPDVREKYLGRDFKWQGKKETKRI